MKTYEVMVSYYPVAALLGLPHLCGIEGHPGTDWKRQSIMRQSLLVRRSRLTVPVWDMCLPIVGGDRKVALLPALLKLRENACLEPCFSSLCFPSVRLGGHRQTAALWTRWMEVGSSAVETERAGKQEREREWDVWRSTSHQTEWQMRGLWSRATFHSDQS